MPQIIMNVTVRAKRKSRNAYTLVINFSLLQVYILHHYRPNNFIKMQDVYYVQYLYLTLRQMIC